MRNRDVEKGSRRRSKEEGGRYEVAWRRRMWQEEEGRGMWRKK